MESIYNMEKFVGIILVNYNGAMDTIECIESINKMSYRNYRIFVVDNYSTDNSVELLSQKKKELAFDLIELPENKGFSAGNNYGIAMALQMGAEYVLLLNNDTIADSDFLRNLMNKTANITKGSVLTGTIYYASQKNKIWYAEGEFHLNTAKVTQIGLKSKKGKLPGQAVKVTFASGCCMCIPAFVFQKVGLLDESYFLYEEDVDYCYRLLQNGIDIYYIPDAVLYHKVSSSTTKTEKMSAVTQYYMVRNKFIFISRYYKFVQKIVPYIHSVLMYTYYCIRYGMAPKYVLWGITDFLKGKKYKTERTL